MWKWNGKLQAARLNNLRTAPADKGQERKGGLALRMEFGIWKPIFVSWFCWKISSLSLSKFLWEGMWAQSKMELLALFYLSGTTLLGLERGLSIRAVRPEKPHHIQASYAFQSWVKTNALRWTNVLAGLFQQNGSPWSEAELEPVKEVRREFVNMFSQLCCHL